jgi:hypothetical protein
MLCQVQALPPFVGGRDGGRGVNECVGLYDTMLT